MKFAVNMKMLPTKNKFIQNLNVFDYLARTARTTRPKLLINHSRQEAIQEHTLNS